MPKRNGTGIALLADPTRRHLISAIALRPAIRPSKLATQLGLSRSTVSRQLRHLREAELVIGHYGFVDGRWITYTVNPARQGQILAWLAGTAVGIEDRDDREHANAGSSASADSAVVAQNDNDRSPVRDG